MNKYEQLIEFIINEQEDKARELFHSIVVEKSREIYESLIDEEDLAEIGGNEVDQMMDEITGEEQGMAEEEEMGDEEPMDSADDMEMDSEEGEAEEAGEEELEDRVMDLEDALDELKAEFDALMAGEEAEEQNFPGIHSDEGGEMAPEVEPEMGMMEEAEEEVTEEEAVEEEEEKVEEEKVSETKAPRKMTEAEWIREYVEKIAAPSNSEGADNKSSVVAGKNDMGGTTANIAKGGEAVGGKVKSPAVNNAGNKNVPGAKAGSQERAPAAKKGEDGGVNKSSVEG